MADKKNNLLTGIVLGAAALMLWKMKSSERRRTTFKNKVVLITGGSRGLGLVLAREFAGEKAKIAICARNGEELVRAENDLKVIGAEVYAGVCDVRRKEEVDSFIKDVANHFGQIDVLINNAGVIQVGPLESQTREDFEDAMAVHFWGPFHTMQAVLPEMKRRGEGRIVNIASIGGKIGVPHLAPYCASKFALVGLSSAMHAELVKDNIFVTTVCPGLMRTGSHINAIFKGKNQLEFALFSTMNALPFTSISAEDAAKEIVEACREGKAEAIISVQAQMAVKAHSMMPELVAEVSGLINQVLPSTGGIETDHATGKESTSFLAPSFLTKILDKASVQNNELKPGEQIA